MIKRLINWAFRKVNNLNDNAGLYECIKTCSNPGPNEDQEHVWILVNGYWHRFTFDQIDEARKRARDNKEDQPF